MKVIALNGGSLNPDERHFCRAKGYGFQCVAPCEASYRLFVPKDLPFGLVEQCQAIARDLCRREHHPNHPLRFEISLDDEKPTKQEAVTSERTGAPLNKRHNSPTHRANEPSYQELKVLHFLRKRGEPLRCQGGYWSMLGAPSLVAARDTLQTMIGRGWLERKYKYDSADHDDYQLSVEGLHAAEGYEPEFLKRLEANINHVIDK